MKADNSNNTIIGFLIWSEDLEWIPLKINELNRMGAVQQYRKQSAAVPSGPAGKGKKDELHISTAAKELLTGDPQAVNRIEELKQSVQNGTYHVDAYQLAEKLLPYLRS